MEYHFAEKVTKAFKFLIEKYNLKCIETSTSFVRYESDTVFIYLHFDCGRSFEVGFEIGYINNKLQEDYIPFNLYEILLSKDAPEVKDFSGFQASSPEKLEVYLYKIAQLVEKYAEDLIEGSQNSFNKIMKTREEECRAYALENELKQARLLAGKAWKNKKYHEYFDLLHPLKDNLMISEKKKLLYAAKKMGGKS